MSLPPERELIEILTRDAGSVRNVAGLTDDCAVVPLGHKDVVATIDTFARPTHFPDGTPPRLMGRMATSAAMSDLAAAGADVLGVLVGYGLPPELDLETAKAVAEGVTSALFDHGGELLGGDTKPRPVLELAVTALGTVPPGKAMSRSKARPGDVVAVTGPLGGAGAALQRIEDGMAPDQAQPLLDPVPRVRAGRRLREAGVDAATDLSDGLAEGAASISQASEARVVIEADEVPLHPWAQEAGDGLELALSFGGDYELLVCFPEEVEEQARRTLTKADGELQVIGRVEAGQGAVLDEPGEQRELDRGYEHAF